MKTTSKFTGGFLDGIEIESHVVPDCNIQIGFSAINHKPGSGSHTVFHRGLYILEAKMNLNDTMTYFYTWKSTP